MTVFTERGQSLNSLCRDPRQETGNYISSYATVVPERGEEEEEEGRGRTERRGLHLNSINTIVLWPSEAQLIWSPMSHVPSSSF